MVAKQTWAFAGAATVSLTVSGVGYACGGGGVVTAESGRVGADVQRVFISVRDDGGAKVTDVITQIGVPQTVVDYGALLPLPTEPTFDAEPVHAEELDRLDALTAPQIYRTESDEGGGIGCGCMGAAAGDASKGGAGANVSEPVNIGPVTAVALTGSTDAVDGWLSENGFTLTAAERALVAEYAGYYFVAVRRNERAAPGGPTSIGIHFTMTGDHRELPLRFASIGAAPTVAFTLFLATEASVAPSPPFVALTLNDLDPVTLRFDYAEAVKMAVRGHQYRAFVLESRTPRDQLGPLDPRMSELIGDSAVTRISTILPAAALMQDAHFYASHDGLVPNERWVKAAGGSVYREASLAGVALLLLAGSWRRGRRGHGRA